MNLIFTVKTGDTLHKIASTYGINLISLMRANKNVIRNYNESRLSDGNYNIIFPGSVIRFNTEEPPRPSDPTNPNIVLVKDEKDFSTYVPYFIIGGLALYFLTKKKRKGR